MSIFNFRYDVKPCEIILVPCELSELISHYSGIVKNMEKNRDVYEMDDRIIVVFENDGLHYIVMKFMNIANNIYEIQTIVLSGDYTINYMAEL